MHAAPHRPSQKSLAAFVEAFAVDKHVLVVGDASDTLGAWLIELGASGVELWDPDDDRALATSAAAPRGLVVRPLPRDAADVRVTGFDLAVVADLGVLEDVEQWVQWIRRWVGDAGVAVFSAPCGPPPEHFEYYELYDLIARQFANVRMVGKVPFSGVAFAEFGVPEDSLAVTVDGQLADGSQVPEAFLAVASHRVINLDPYLIVELPPSAGGTGNLAEAAPLVDPELRQALDQKEAETAKLAKELDERAAEVGRLASDLATSRAALDKAQTQAHARVEHERGESQAQSRRAEAAERQLAAVRADLARAIETQASEVIRYEAALSERATAIRTLEVDLAERERMIHELVDGLEEGTAAGVQTLAAAVPSVTAAAPIPSEQDAQLPVKLDAMALELARREGEAQASAWRIAELERSLAELRECQGKDGP
jgi:hypothetical protein